MKKLFFILTTILITTTHLPAQDILQAANDAYAKGDFTKAIEWYEAALKENGESATVYYNLGNSYYKINKIASSILNYERALLLAPGNGDIHFNLEIAKLKTVDKIEPVGEFFLTSWFHSIEDSLSTDAWSRFAIACFILLIGCLFLFFFSRKILIKKLGFYAGICLFVLVVFGNIFAYNQKKSLTQRDSAIIFVPTTTIKSSPADSGTDLFILHEGAKVKLKNKISNWNEIETADGNVGWIKSSEIAVI
ncbi:MAG: tetratricopeptide repeat protein [Dysgonamonadaceae bacterium]|jgi:tetratricopeptide (TPR) repeat protein|nr:tetratricopeptide repeat protein [Dysgonamonadaceae bacterium]